MENKLKEEAASFASKVMKKKKIKASIYEAKGLKHLMNVDEAMQKKFKGGL